MLNKGMLRPRTDPLFQRALLGYILLGGQAWCLTDGDRPAPARCPCASPAPQARYAVEEVRYTDELAEVLGELAPPCLHVLDGGVNTDRCC